MVFEQGDALYKQQCASCHGANGAGGVFPAFFVTGSEIQSDPAMIDYIAAQMPLGAVGDCDSDCAAKILHFAKATFDGYYGDSHSGGNEMVTLAMPQAVMGALNGSKDLLNVFWNDASDSEEGFSIERKVGSGNWTVVSMTIANAGVYVDGNISKGQSYQYRIRAFKGAVFSEYSVSNVIDVPADVVVSIPVAPSNVAATVVSDVVQISWADQSSNENGFVVESRIAGGAWSQLAMTAMNVTAFTHASVEAGSSYQYRVQAFNEAGNSSVALSNVIAIEEATKECVSSAAAYVAGTQYQFGSIVSNKGSEYQCTVAGWCSSGSALHYEPGSGLNWQDAWKVTSGSSTADCTDTGNEVVVVKPSAPQTINVVAGSGMASINVSWSDTSDSETGFKIERKVNGSAWAAISELTANATLYADSNVATGSTYQYRVAAFNRSGVSAFITSSELALQAAQTLPSAPLQLMAAFNANEDGVVMTWLDQADNESGFKIERKTNGGSWLRLSTLASNVKTYTDLQIEAATTYQYRVAAFNEKGDSAFVASSSLTSKDAPVVVSANQQVYDAKCTACHTASGGIGGNLLDARMSTKWAAQSYDSLLSKVNTMQAANCDAACKAKAADYLWLEAWGLQKQVVVVANGRGVRGLRLLEPNEYMNAVKDLTGVQVSADKLPKHFYDSKFKYPTQADTGVVLYEGMQKYLSLAQSIAQAANLTLVGCSSTACTSSQTNEMGLRVLRRPLTSTELSTYQNINTSYGAREMLASMLMSPYFLYKIELGTWNASEAAYELTDYEVASSLAFMLWGTTPDADLLARAKNNQLSSVAGIEAAIDVIFANDKFAQNMDKFIKFYSHSEGVLSEKPGLNTAVINAMYDERSEFIRYWLNNDDASFNKLFNPGYTFLNKTLASQYGLSDSQTSMHKVATDRNRGGLLHHGLTQIANSDFNATSLVRRGKMIRENMLCHDLGVPSGVDPASITLPSRELTTRERWDIITGPTASDGQCWECHKLMNEPGSAFERFDAAGRYRTTEADYNGSMAQLVLDTAGVLRDNSGNNEKTYQDARELTEYLGQSTQAKTCFVDSYLRFATGHRSDAYNKEELEGLQAQFVQDDNVKQMLKRLGTSSLFRLRLDRL